MDQQTTAALIRLCQARAENARDDYERRAAAVTGGLPVYSDWTGVVVLTPQGDVMYCDDERATAEPPSEDGWRLLALVKAARRYPELISLLPTRPANSALCSRCGGSGFMFGNFDCGYCMGIGWVQTDPVEL